MTEQHAHPSFDTIADFLIADHKVLDGLSTADRRLAEIGCLLAVDPASPELLAIFREAYQAGSLPESLEDMLIHAIGYLGVIVVRRAHELLMIALTEIETTATHDVVVCMEPNRRLRVETGARLYDRFDPGRQAKQEEKFAALSPAYYPRAMELSGLILASPMLALRERQIMTVAMLSCLGGQTEQLRFHIGVALRNNVQRETLASILILVQAYAGMPRANSAADLALDVLKQNAR